MKTIQVTKRFDYEVPGKGGRVSLCYMPGLYERVPEAHAEAMIEAGCAEDVMDQTIDGAESGDSDDGWGTE